MNASERSLKAMKALRAQNDELLARVDSLVQERDGLLRAFEELARCFLPDEEIAGTSGQPAFCFSELCLLESTEPLAYEQIRLAKERGGA